MKEWTDKYGEKLAKETKKKSVKKSRSKSVKPKTGKKAADGRKKDGKASKS